MKLKVKIYFRNFKMSCTLAKCWPGAFDQPCGGTTKPLTSFSESPSHFLQASHSFSRFGENPDYQWQLWLSFVTAASFSPEEMSMFNICKSHEVCSKCKFKIQHFISGIFQEEVFNKKILDH